MKSVAQGAAGTAGGDAFSWLLGLAGAGDNEAEVLDEISNELNTIEATLEGIETELKELLDITEVSNCIATSSEVSDAVTAIQQVWNLQGLGTGLGDSQETTYVGIAQNTKAGLVEPADLQTFADIVLDNDGQGKFGSSIEDHLLVINTNLLGFGVPGILQTCILSNGDPGDYAGTTDDVYYEENVVPILSAYYTIQTQGMTMVAAANYFEAWVSAGSPGGTPQNIGDIPAMVCNESASQTTIKKCNDAVGVVYPAVTGRIRQQLIVGGAPYTWDGGPAQGPTHRYVNDTTLWASSPALFSSINQSHGEPCPELDSNDPCGALVGSGFSDTKIVVKNADMQDVGAQYGYYGREKDGSWVAADGRDWGIMFGSGNPSIPSTYPTVGDWLMGERGFIDLPENTIFGTNVGFNIQPFGQGSHKFGVYQFTDTGLDPTVFPTLFDQTTRNSFFGGPTSGSLLREASRTANCDVRYVSNPLLPPSDQNRGFYEAEYCNSNVFGASWTNNKPPGWEQGSSTKQAQFRFPVLDITKLNCVNQLPSRNPAGAATMCGDDLYAWLDELVPPNADLDPTVHTLNCGKEKHNGKASSNRCWPQKNGEKKPAGPSN